MKTQFFTLTLISLSFALAKEPKESVEIERNAEGAVTKISGASTEEALEIYKNNLAEMKLIQNQKREAEEATKISAMDETARLLYLEEKEETRRKYDEYGKDAEKQRLARETDRSWVIANAASIPPEEAIPRLAHALYFASDFSQNKMIGTTDYYQSARDALYSIPGHAEYFIKELDGLRDKMLGDAKAENMRYGLDYYGYDRWREHVFEKLGRMQTPETVRVLGDMFDDLREIHPFPEPGEGYNAAPNAILALLTLRDSLHVSGLPSAPLALEHMSHKEVMATPLKELFEADLAPWREWYAELKAGKRTYHFEDSETEYNWDGSLAKKIALRKDHKPSGETADNSSSIAKPAAAIIHPSEERNDTWLVIMASTIAGILLLIASWKSFIKPRLS